MGRAKENLIDYPKKLQRPTMAELSDELIFEIIARLPLKNVVQCMLLNKTFFNWISSPTFQRRLLSSSRSSNTSIFYYCHDIYTRNYPKTQIFTRITPQSSNNGGIISEATTNPSMIQPLIMASCNGVLLISFLFRHPYHVFNPFTGGLSFVDYPLNLHHNVGLAVDLKASNDHHFKLVAIDVNSAQNVLVFSVVVPSANGVRPATFRKSKVDFECTGFTLMQDKNTRSVYARGCLHWLGKDRLKIVVFDVEKEEARIMKGPGFGFHSGGVDELLSNKWFGFADGSLQFVHALQDEIVVYSQDYIKDEWRVKHKIAYLSNRSPNNVWTSTPMFFDGRRLFLQMRKNGKNGEVQIHDVLSDEWEKFGEMETTWNYEQHFVSYFPTLAKVSKFFLLRHDTPGWNAETFRQLQTLLKYPD